MTHLKWRTRRKERVSSNVALNLTCHKPAERQLPDDTKLASQSVLFTFDQIKPHEFKIMHMKDNT